MKIYTEEKHDNDVIEELAAEYEGLTYMREDYDSGDVAEEGYVRVEVPPQNTPETIPPESISVGYPNPSNDVCAKCAFKNTCSGTCSLMIDYGIDEDEYDERDKEDLEVER